MNQRWVLVTGGARRLGRELCLAFAQNHWHVICHYRESAQDAIQLCSDIADMGCKAVALFADMSTTGEQDMLFRKSMDVSGGRLDAIVSNASLFEADTGIDFSPELLQRQLQLNLIAPLYLGKLLARSTSALNRVRPHAIIHILDQKVFNLNPDYFSYTVSKLALERAVALQAQALAPHVRVTGVAPGLIYVSGPQDESNFRQARSVNLLRTPTSPADVARTAVFLAENESITGVTLSVDKGQHLVPLDRDIMFVADRLMSGLP